MTPETEHFDRKSLRKVTGKTVSWTELALDCVCFANAQGGSLWIGFEDDEDLPPPGQTVPEGLLEHVRKRIQELTVNVQVVPRLMVAANNAEWIELAVVRAIGVASTVDGRYSVRIGDTCCPVVGDDVMRLINDRPARPWELLPVQGLTPAALDAQKVAAFVAAIRGSDRVKDSVREKTPAELLVHYDLTFVDGVTQLGALLLGRREDRARLGTASVVQCLKFDERGVKVNKWVWDDHSLSPVELVDAVWQGVPDFRESYELPDGLYRRNVAAFDEKVLRELLVNALVHRPYTQRGDIFLNLHPDRLEVVNPGRLPLGVTPQTILHASRRRNDGMARVFHDLKLMEREGSGFDLMYDLLLASGRPAPVLTEGTDFVRVTIGRRILKPQVIALLDEADRCYQLSQRERITLSALAQRDGLTARELCAQLELADADALKPWLGRLLVLGLLQSSGRTKGLRYFVEPGVLRDAQMPIPTTLRRIEPYRLHALVLEDLRRYPLSAIGEIHARMGTEVARAQLKRVLADTVGRGEVLMAGVKRAARYRLKGVE